MAAKPVIRAVVSDVTGLEAVQSPIWLAMGAGWRVDLLLASRAATAFTYGRVKLDEHISPCVATNSQVAEAFWARGECDLIVVGVPKSDELDQVFPLVRGMVSDHAPVVIVQGPLGLLIPVLDELLNKGSSGRLDRVCVANRLLQRAAATRYEAFEFPIVETASATDVWNHMQAAIMASAVMT